MSVKLNTKVLDLPAEKMPGLKYIYLSLQISVSITESVQLCREGASKGAAGTGRAAVGLLSSWSSLAVMCTCPEHNGCL